MTIEVNKKKKITNKNMSVIFILKARLKYDLLAVTKLKIDISSMA